MGGEMAFDPYHLSPLLHTLFSHPHRHRELPYPILYMLLGVMLDSSICVRKAQSCVE